MMVKNRNLLEGKGAKMVREWVFAALRAKLEDGPVDSVKLTQLGLAAKRKLEDGQVDSIK